MQDQEIIISRLKSMMTEVQRSKIEQFNELILKSNAVVAELFGDQYTPFSITNRQKFKHEDSPSAKYMKEMYWLQTNRPNLISFLRNFINELETKKRIYILYDKADEMKEIVENFVKQLRFIPRDFYDVHSPRKSIIEELKIKNDVGFIIVVLSSSFNDENSSDPLKNQMLRHDVFFDLGYLAGKVSMEKVFALYRENDQFQVPTDLQDVLYRPFKEGWQKSLCEDLKLCGYTIED